MTDSKFTAEYKNSVTDVIENVVLPTNYKSKILSALREEAKKTETQNTETPIEIINQKETEENETLIEIIDQKETQPQETSETTTENVPEINPEATADNTNVISIDSEKYKKSNKAKRFISIFGSIAAAIVLIASVLLIRGIGFSNIPTTELKFTLSSATNLASISGAKVTFRNSNGEVIKNKDGTPVTAYSDENGTVAVTLPEADSYTAIISAEGYIDYQTTIQSSHIYISPVMNENTYRAVLTWENPCDLDAILTVTHEDKTEQLYYFNSNIYDENNELIAALDTDSAVAGAPETITFNTTDEGLFRFSVASYSSLTPGGKADLGPSGAKVTLYKGDNIIDTFDVNPDIQDNAWCVFEIKGSTLSVANNTYSVDAITEVQ